MHVVYGGAFNPPTKAHLDVFYFLDHEIRIDTFTYLPVGKAYEKDGLASDRDRLSMLNRMVAHLESVQISTLEMEDGTYKGTYASLKRLQRNDEPMAFVIGADHLESLHQWKNADKLLEEFTCLVLNREASKLEDVIEKDPFLKKHKDNLHIYRNFKVDISSSDFRRTKDSTLLVPSVYAYIKAHGLYGIPRKG